MKRALDRLSDSEYDLVVVGGGIHGAFAAWDGVQRGMRVALVEQGDFAGATSGNSQRIIHSGLRYLQQFDLARVRESARERRILMRIAPHFVRPLPCLLAMERGREVPPALLSMGLQLYRLLVRERSGPLGSGPAIPPPRRISGQECVNLWPELACVQPSAGLLYSDGYARDAERLVLAVLTSASRSGADLANYVRVVGPLRNGQPAVRVPVVDVLSNRAFEIRTRMVVNCSGPWAAHVRGRLCGRSHRQRLLKAVLLATKPIVRELALGVPARRPKVSPEFGATRDRYLFFTPDRSGSLLGTWYTVYERHPDEFSVTSDEIARIIEEVNQSYPAATLQLGDIRRVYGGLLPADRRPDGGADTVLARRHRIYDDGATPDPVVVSIVGVKFTTARAVAAQAVDHAVWKMGIRSAPCRTHEQPLFGGEDIPSHDSGLRKRVALESSLSEDMAGHILDVYGSRYESVLAHVRENPSWAAPVSPVSNVIGAQVVHAARHEMAQKLSDVVFRRTGLGASGTPDSTSLRTCAAILSSELDWTESRTREEVAEIESARVVDLRS